MSPLPKKTELKFLLDENVDVRLASFLKKRGFSVLLSSKGFTNGEIVSLAVKESCVLLTNDKDFVNLEPAKSLAVVIIRIHPPTLSKLESALDKLLKKIPSDDFSGKIFLLSEEGIEVRE